MPPSLLQGYFNILFRLFKKEISTTKRKKVFDIIDRV